MTAHGEIVFGEGDVLFRQYKKRDRTYATLQLALFILIGLPIYFATAAAMRTMPMEGRCLQAVGAWETLFQDPDDARYWEQTYPQSERHGGGPPALECLSREQAQAKYGDEII